MHNLLNKTVRTITAYLAVIFVVYCSVGVCSQMLAKTPGTPAMMDAAHAHHQMAEQPYERSMGANHCDESNSCEWSLNPFSEVGQWLDESSFFFAYVIATAALILQWGVFSTRGRRSYAFFREQFFQYTYPRLHLQQAVFLN